MPQWMNSPNRASVHQLASIPLIFTNNHSKRRMSVRYSGPGMPVRIPRAVPHDVRFPTSRTLDGSDAMNPDPDYSAAYVVLHTDRGDALQGHGLTFTIGRGNELCVAAIEALAHHVVGLTLEQVTSDLAGFWRALVHDSQLRWLGPEKGVVHLAAGALVNAVWDLYAKAETKPLWKLLADLTPEQVVAA